MPTYKLTSTLLWIYGLFYSSYYGGKAAIIASGKGGEMPPMPFAFNFGWFILFFGITLVLEYVGIYIEEKAKGGY